MAPSRPCDECGRPTSEPRRGLCATCWERAPAAIPAYGACAACRERRRILLRWTRLASGLVLTCYNCGHVADVARSPVRDVPALRALLSRDRRSGERRRRPLRVDADGGRRRGTRRLPERISPA